MNLSNSGPIPPGMNPFVFKNSFISEQNTKIINDKKSKYSILLGTLNICLICLIWYDITTKCPVRSTYYLYVEYFLITIFFFNSLYYFWQYFMFRINRNRFQVYNQFNFENTLNSSQFCTPKRSQLNTPMNITANSWRSNTSSFNDSRNFNSSQPFTYDQDSSKLSNSCQLGSSVGDETINDEHSLSKFLKQYSNFEKSTSVGKNDQQSNSGSPFWNHPAAKNNETSTLLRRCNYQLSPISSEHFYKFTGLENKYPESYQESFNQNNSSYLPCERCNCCCICNNGVCRSSSNSPGTKLSDKFSPNINTPLGIEMWRRFHVDSVTLTQWNANIRLWISQTIVERLVKEIDFIDNSLQKQGIADVQIGQIGLDRLKKTAQMLPVLQGVPTLWTLIPFLELTTNQEYLIRRLRELSKGGCMSSFKWNGGGSYNGKDWNDSLPSDSAIIMHLFSTYMDSQLLPLPNKPDTKPFTGYHFIKFTNKIPILESSTLAIQEISNNPPHYRVIVGEEIFEMVKGYNNLFNTLLLFLYQVTKRENGVLGRVHLGKAGVNILWVIDS